MTEDQIAEARLLVVDDEEAMRAFLERALRREGFRTVAVSNGREACERMTAGEEYDLVLTDLRMPEMGGMELLHWMRSHHARVPVLVMTGHGSISNAVEALRAGAENYVTKPFDRDEIRKAVRDALLKGRLAAENRVLKGLLEEGRRFEGMVGSSAPMRRLYSQIDAVAERSGTVLVTGETGTGKELVARALHARSPRAEGPFIAFHCASMPPSIISAELFGVEEGAFTGASRSRLGAVGRAEGGTLFLDEVGDIPTEVQPALLRLLDASETTAVGSNETRIADVRIVAATHRDLGERVASGALRQDLFFRLNVFPVDVPALRKRREDIPDLVRHFLALRGHDEGVMSLEALALLEAGAWPGNVRQLENTIDRMIALRGEETLGPESIPDDVQAAADSPASTDESGRPLKEAVTAFERRYLTRLLERVRGNVSAAAREAGISRPTLHAKIQQLRIDPDRFR